MKKNALLFLLMAFSIYNYAAVVQGTVVNMSNAPVANQLVHITDSSGGVQLFALQGTTNASGVYSITLPSTISSGAFLHVFTEKCGITVVTTNTFTGASITDNFTVCGTSNTGNTVSGTVTLGSTSNAAYPAKVYLIRKSYNSGIGSYFLTCIDSTATVVSGEFHFYNVNISANDLLVKAALTPANTQYANYLPTYKENSLTWNTAHVVSFTPGANNIHMVAGTNPGGPGFVGGSVLQGANKGTAVGDPLENRIVILTTVNDDAVAYTYTDAGGAFSFPNLAYGTYKLFGDAWGKDNPATTVTIDAGHPAVTNVVFQENDVVFTATGIAGLNQLPSVAVYPNPAKDVITIAGLDKISGTKTVTLTDLAGTKVSEQSTSSSELTISIARLPAGIYEVHIQTTAGNASYKLVK